MIFSPARSGRDNSTKDTLDNVAEIREVVINIVNYAIVEQMSLSSTAYEKGINEFEKAGFTSVESTIVTPPRVGEAPVSFECVVDNIVPLGTGPGAGNLVIAKVVMIHVNSKYLDQDRRLDTTQLDLVGRMGGVWYNRCSKEALFAIPKPNSQLGIGIDGLPGFIQQMNYFSGNELARLGNVHVLPNIEDEIRINNNGIIHGNREAKKNEILLIARQLISENEPNKALSLLMKNEAIFSTSQEDQ